MPALSSQLAHPCWLPHVLRPAGPNVQRCLLAAAQVAADASPHRALLQFSAAAMKSAAAATEPVCCNIQPGITPQKIWYCDTAMGWYPNQASANLPNPSNEVCCLVGARCSAV